MTEKSRVESFYVSGFDTKVSEKLAGSNPNCRRIVAVITVGTFRGFGTERVRLGTFKGFDTEHARRGTFNQYFLIFHAKLQICPSFLFFE